MALAETSWALVPPLVTILLALTTKEVYMSLGIGIFAGALMYTDFQWLHAVDTLFTIMFDKIGTHAYVLIFLVLLGILVEVISCSGAAKAYGEWAVKAIHGKRSALFVTMVLGILIFIDDYFNCVTVGTVMRPVTDKFHITRAKLAYIIDATAAPVCIIAPISSWAAAVSSALPSSTDTDGFTLFLQTIPFNLYPWLTLLFMVLLIWRGKDYFTMAAYEKSHKGASDIPEEYEMEADEEEDESVGNGKIIDLLLPIGILILSCIYCMLYTGGIHEGRPLWEALSESEPAKSLVMGTFLTLLFTMLFYLSRRVLDYKRFCECLTMGFIDMTSAIFILCLAWTLAGICGDEYLNLGGFVGNVISDNVQMAMFLPSLFFLASIGLSFATGTSWGTFGILIPIVVSVVGMENSMLLTTTVSAVLAGAVGGDHVSPLSDTTILASAGAQCHHIDHVSTQIPYVIVVSVCCFLGYLAAGFTENGWIGMVTGIAALLIAFGWMCQWGRER